MNYIASDIGWETSSVKTCVKLAEPRASYQSFQPRLLEVLVDCPGLEGLYTYRLPEGLRVQPGDIVSIPFGSQQIGGIAIRLVNHPPQDLPQENIKEIEGVIAQSFFAPSYWQLLQQVADYYATELMTVVRTALPPGLFRRSQQRVVLQTSALPTGASTFCSPTAQQILQLLQQSKTGDYSVKYLRQKVKGAYRGIRELSQRGWLKSYLAYRQPPQAKKQKAVTLVGDFLSPELTKKQREVVEILRHHGGELWLQQLLKISQASTSIVETLAKKGYLTIQAREFLRLEGEGSQGQEIAKTLTPAQAQALDAINSVNGFAQILLHGVTGSGKTEVYLHAVAPLLNQGKSALVLVPEIGLTPQLTDRFRQRFRDRVLVYHSALSDGERYDTWRLMLQENPYIIIGTRSAIFAPLANLGIIILDEEHDSSFKQHQPAPTYHTRTVAQWRAESASCPLVLGTATPSLETWSTTKLALNQALDNPALYLSLPERIKARPLPPIEIVDMRRELQQGNRSLFSRSLHNAIAEMHQRGEQGILFISRRGHSTFVSCRTCGYVIECPHCDVSLSYHYTHEGAQELLRCHYCNHQQLQPKSCPSCSSPYLKFFGTGTQKIIHELKREFPQLHAIRFDSDTTRTKGAHRRLLTQFANHEADLLVGTQMLTKGLDLSQVTLVGVVAADGMLHRADYRAPETAFHTLTQVAGRAGRGEQPGRVIIQTYSPQHPVIEAVCRHDYDSFVEQELGHREALGYPPYGKLIALKFSGLEAAAVEKSAEAVADACGEIIPSEAEILGPAPAMVMRVARRYRWQILVKFPGEVNITQFPWQDLRRFCVPSVAMTIDVDPLRLD